MFVFYNDKPTENGITRKVSDFNKICVFYVITRKYCDVTRYSDMLFQRETSLVKAEKNGSL